MENQSLHKKIQEKIIQLKENQSIELFNELVELFKEKYGVDSYKNRLTRFFLEPALFIKLNDSYIQDKDNDSEIDFDELLNDSDDKSSIEDYSSSNNDENEEDEENEDEENEDEENEDNEENEDEENEDNEENEDEENEEDIMKSFLDFMKKSRNNTIEDEPCGTMDETNNNPDETSENIYEPINQNDTDSEYEDGNGEINEQFLKGLLDLSKKWFSGNMEDVENDKIEDEEESNDEEDESNDEEDESNEDEQEEENEDESNEDEESMTESEKAQQEEFVKHIDDAIPLENVSFLMAMFFGLEKEEKQNFVEELKKNSSMGYRLKANPFYLNMQQSGYHQFIYNKVTELCGEDNNQNELSLEETNNNEITEIENNNTENEITEIENNNTENEITEIENETRIVENKIKELEIE